MNISGLKATSFIASAMQLGDLDAVMAIEEQVFSHPWTRGNFIDSLEQNDEAWVFRFEGKHMAGYFVVKNILDEAHLLTVAVHPMFQRQGLGMHMMHYLLNLAKRQGMQTVTLEVRQSNQSAIALYLATGFVEVGRRTNYYPVNIDSNGTRDSVVKSREDALIFTKASLG